MVFWFSVAVCGAALLGQVLRIRARTSFLKTERWPAFLFLISLAFVVGYYFFLTYAQYVSWKGNQFSAYFLPPFRSVSYLFSYHLVRFLMYYGVSLLAGAAAFLLAGWANKKFGGRFFEVEEPWLAWLAIFLLGNRAWFSGWAWVFYIILLFGGYVLIHISFLAAATMRNGKFSDTPRVPFYWLWMTVALLIIISAQ